MHGSANGCLSGGVDEMMIKDQYVFAAADYEQIFVFQARIASHDLC